MVPKSVKIAREVERKRKAREKMNRKLREVREETSAALPKNLDAAYCELTLVQRKALPHFLKPIPFADSCADADISTATFYSWYRKAPGWRAIIDHYTHSCVEEAKHNIQRSSTKASQVAAKKLDSANEGVQLKAVNTILEYNTKYANQDKIIAAIQELQQLFSASDESPPRTLGIAQDAAISTAKEDDLAND